MWKKKKMRVQLNVSFKRVNRIGRKITFSVVFIFTRVVKNIFKMVFTFVNKKKHFLPKLANFGQTSHLDK